MCTVGDLSVRRDHRDVGAGGPDTLPGWDGSRDDLRQTEAGCESEREGREAGVADGARSSDPWHGGLREKRSGVGEVESAEATNEARDCIPMNLSRDSDEGENGSVA